MHSTNPEDSHLRSVELPCVICCGFADIVTEGSSDGDCTGCGDGDWTEVVLCTGADDGDEVWTEVVLCTGADDGN